MANKCKMCGTCCKLFYINLNKEEYESGRYKTMFTKFKGIKSFADAKKYGANFLAKKENGDCIYLENNYCRIHQDRPHVCKGFFCTSKNQKHKNMQKIVKKNNLGMVFF